MTHGADDAPDLEGHEAELQEISQLDPHDRAEVRHLRRQFLADAAIEAEKATGHRERTDEEARRSLWVRLAQLIGGWLLVLLGLAAIPLPGPGWLLVLLGLSLLPYRWTDNLIRTIRRRIPGIPEDGRIPTRTWVITGLLVVLATGASLWWGLRDSDDGPNEDAAGVRMTLAKTTSTTPSEVAEPIVVASSSEPARVQLAALYGSVAATATDRHIDHVTSADPCADASSGKADLVLLTQGEMVACFGGESDDQLRAGASGAGLKTFAPVVTNGVTYYLAIRTDAIAIDDEPAELALDGVSGQISAGADTSGDPTDRAHTLMKAAGVLK